MAGNTEVQDFYQDCEVLVTGGTGFLGKLTVEKVLRSCPGVRRVHLLVRPKKGLSVEQRKKILLDDVVFERMKREQPDSVEKIVFVSGDCSAPRLGLRDSDYHNMTQHVNIVLHLAANVRLDEKLKVAVDVNVKGTQEVTQLCRECVSLKAAVLVSTAYSNCHQQVIEEKLYDPPLTVEDTFILLEKFTEHELVLLSEKIIRPWPNTYVFSKAIAENVVLTQGKGLPVVIVRPSIVIWTIKEPLKGWIDNMYGPISIAMGVGCGILRVTYTNETGLIDMVPGDIVTNCIITSALAANNSFLNICKKIQKHSVLTNYFSRKNWTFFIGNTTKLYERLSPKNKKLFPFDTRTINWRDTIVTVSPECRKYILNESLDNLDEARSKYQKFYIAHTLMKIILWVIALYTIQFYALKYLF